MQNQTIYIFHNYPSMRAHFKWYAGYVVPMSHGTTISVYDSQLYARIVSSRMTS